MKTKQIIDEVDVSWCEWIREIELDSEYICTCNSLNKTSSYCKDNPNCHYKQLAREKQKLSKIKEIIEIHKDSKCAICPKFDECFDHPSCDNVILQIIDSKRG